MANQVPPNVVDLLKSLVGAIVIQQQQIAELQGDRTVLLEANEKLTAEIAALQGHAEIVTGDAGLTTQLGDLSAVPALQEQLAAALPAPAEPAVAPPAAEPANSSEPQQAAA